MCTWCKYVLRGTYTKVYDGYRLPTTVMCKQLVPQEPLRYRYEVISNWLYECFNLALFIKINMFAI